LTEDEAKNIFEKITRCYGAKEFQKMPKNMQAAYIRELRSSHLSLSQISMFTGLTKNIVRNREITK
jgi:hypothetical protein